jgi:hypothetical protein
MGESTRAARTKILLAVLGGAAVMGMGAVVVATDDGVLPAAPAVAAPVLPGPMTQGGTVTTTAAVTVLATEKAVVTHKAQPYKG